MPSDSFESPFTLTVCVGHVELAMVLLERGANMEDSNDEVYTPLMEAIRESHEEMVVGDCSHLCRSAKNVISLKTFHCIDTIYVTKFE